MEEISAIARKRLEERLSKAPKFDRKACLRELVYNRYRLDINKLFPDGKYAFDKLKSESEVRAILQKRIQQILDREYPMQMKEKLKRQAQQEIPCYHLGDKVTITIAYPGQAVMRKSGVLQEVTPQNIVISDQRFALNDIQEPPAWAFDVKAATRKRENFLYYHYEKPRMLLKKKLEKTLTEKVFLEFGWVKEKGRLISLQEAYSKYILPELEKKEKAYYEKLREQLEIQIAEEMRREGLLQE
ncbi:MAG: hypothetical protein D6820_02730 [Lentisphaerae bacterium]|nr:MAG: hypothetical protein D6820_02730 [Lentisphaerota bacterium]